MYSNIIPLEDLQQFSKMYWLPPNGRDNGVFAGTWVLLADIEKADGERILDTLADAGIGGYIATSNSPKAGADNSDHLYVDRVRYNDALDITMICLRGKQPRPEGAPAPLRTEAPGDLSRWHAAASSLKQSPVMTAVGRVVLVLTGFAFIALILAGVYHEGAERYPSAAHHHHADTHGSPVSGATP